MAKRESELEFLASRLEVTGIHMVSAFVIGYIDTPWFRHQRQFDTFSLVYFKEFPEAIAAFELVKCKLHFNNVEGQEVAGKLAVVWCRVVALLESSEETLEISLSIFKSLIVRLVRQVNTVLFRLKRVRQNFSVSLLSVSSKQLTLKIHNYSYPSSVHDLPADYFLEALERLNKVGINVIFYDWLAPVLTRIDNV